jgi:hypothetical protein
MQTCLYPARCRNSRKPDDSTNVAFSKELLERGQKNFTLLTVCLLSKSTYGFIFPSFVSKWPITGGRERDASLSQLFSASKSAIITERDEQVQELLRVARDIGQVGADASEADQEKVTALAKKFASLSDDAPARRPLQGVHNLVYSASKGGNSGKIGPFVGKVTQTFAEDGFFYNKAQFGPLWSSFIYVSRTIIVAFRSTHCPIVFLPSSFYEPFLQGLETAGTAKQNTVTTDDLKFLQKANTVAEAVPMLQETLDPAWIDKSLPKRNLRERILRLRQGLGRGLTKASELPSPIVLLGAPGLSEMSHEVAFARRLAKWAILSRVRNLRFVLPALVSTRKQWHPL